MSSSDPLDSNSSASADDQYGTENFSSEPAKPASQLPGEEPDMYATDNSAAVPGVYTQLGRYRIDHSLGRGGFGEVFQAFDNDLQRAVAIKITFANMLATKDRDAFLNEARIVASLDHPNIVPVHDVGQTPDGDYYIVSKLIDGSDLASRLRNNRPDRDLSLEIVAAIANALHHAHSKGLVHRDVKPGNILLDRDSRPFLTDFGIAMRETELGGHGPSSGTPAYMSPEQARGEGHRVDGRSDIYSLGVVLYELLTGRRPFRSNSLIEMISLISSHDVRTPRMFDETIPSELERICLKALARRSADRYPVAHDFAEELTWLLNSHSLPKSKPIVAVSSHTEVNLKPVTPPTGDHANEATDSHKSGPTRVIPKGLRSFDSNDAVFFLELLPGPCDRDGLPESLRFWKSRIEQVDPDECFKVGLIYGPSGCGKSSLMKAGLLPRLSKKVISVYVEASPEDTEKRLINGIRKVLPEAQGKTLREMLAAIRRQSLVPAGGKLVLILDQFEQWLHAEVDYVGASLTDALRQCDGVQIQAIVMVRDDFWLSVSRFLRELEVRILEGENSALVDLFDLDHSAKVLSLFGKAFKKLPDSSSQWAPDQHEFIRQAVQGLSQDRKVISVRLAIFAEMMKSREWTTATLREVGGIEGIGVTFLEETFAAKHAPPEHRVHRDAVRGLLAALLPPMGTDIKGSMRSADALCIAAGYERQPREFGDLMELLDRRLRLITPVDQINSGAPLLAGDGRSNSSSPRPLGDGHLNSGSPRPLEDGRLNSGSPRPLGEGLGVRDKNVPISNTTAHSFSPFTLHASNVHYQLTHDYLVPSLRDWLTRKQRETRKGRAELKLEERTATWNTKRENKQLPTIAEWLRIRSLTDSRRWTDPQRAMMRSAGKLHGMSWGGGLVALLLIGAGIQAWVSAERWKNLKEQTRVAAESLQNNLGPSIPVNIKELRKLPRELALAELTKRFDAATNPGHKLAIAFALANYGRVETDYLVSRINDIAETDTGNFITALKLDRDRAISILKTTATKCVDKSLWRTKAKTAIAAMAFGNSEIAADMCTYADRPDPEQRTLFIDLFPQWELDVGAILTTVRGTDSSALRSGICLAVGGIPSDRVSEANQELWKTLASHWYVEKGDTSTHSAASWLLRQWKFNLPEISKQNEIMPQRDWFVNSVGSTMLRIKPDPPDVNLPDPIEKYLQQLKNLENVAALEKENPKNRETRAIAYFHTGKTEEALKDLDRLLTDAAIDRQPTILQYRTLALAKLGRADEARESLVTYQGAKVLEYRKACVEIQVSAWLGETETASRQLEAAMRDFSVDEADYRWYYLASAAALCAQATADRATVASTQFVEKAFEFLARSCTLGYGDSRKLGYAELLYLIQDPDFAILHSDPRFVAMLRKWKTLDEYWVADREVTRGQIEQFMTDEKVAVSDKPEEWEGVDVRTSPTAAHPAQNVSWYDAVKYCNWLSVKEGRSPCFRRNGTKEKGSSGAEEFDAWEEIPSATGYRLMQKSEWEYSCRAGTQTLFSIGNDEILLSKYCQMFPAKLTSIVGSKLPNAWGLHDMHGNVGEWCFDKENSLDSSRMLGGSGWYVPVQFNRSAFSYALEPKSRSDHTGFRLALSPSSESGIKGAKPAGVGTEGATAEQRP